MKFFTASTLLIAATSLSGGLVSAQQQLRVRKTTGETSIPLPDSFKPEGIARGDGSEVFVGSIQTGAIWKGDLQSGVGSLLVPEAVGRNLNGVRYDERSHSVYAAARNSKKAYRFDSETGAQLNEWLFDTGAFTNDIIITDSAVYITDSKASQLYKIPVDEEDGTPGVPETIAINPTTIGFEDGKVNLNGIEATPNGKTLLLVNSNNGIIYAMDTETNEVTVVEIDYESYEGENSVTFPDVDTSVEDVKTGDGLILSGKTLYVVENRRNRISKIELANNYMSGELVDILTNDEFDIPTTGVVFNSGIYTVNAKFGTKVVVDGIPTTYGITRTETESASSSD